MSPVVRVEKPITPFQAAQRVGAWLRHTYGVSANDMAIWGREDVARHGWGQGADAQVAHEGTFEWAIAASNAIMDGEINLPGVFAEPCSGWLLCFYKDPEWVPQATTVAKPVLKPGTVIRCFTR